jgi:hypothetical protein
MPEKYTFNASTRYMTKGISEQVPLELQLFMWSEIDKLVLRSESVDYLQVFEISIKENYIELEHRQEVPSYQKIHKLKRLKDDDALDQVKIFVIDDIDHSTMLLAIEY